MKIFKFLTGAAVVFGATIESNPTQIGTESDDVSIAILAESLDKIKFELNEILASREQERDHLENRIIDLENKLQQVQTIEMAISAGEFDEDLFDVEIDPDLIARKEEKAETSYQDRLLSLISDF